MPLHVFTAPFSYRGPDRLDITRKSGGPAGHPFAPSWRILGKALAARRAARALPAAQADDLARRGWDDYAGAYLTEMSASRARAPEAWQQLLARPRVVLVCYCPTREQCHRGLLAELLERRGAVDEGELGVSQRFGGALRR